MVTRLLSLWISQEPFTFISPQLYCNSQSMNFKHSISRRSIMSPLCFQSLYVLNRWEKINNSATLTPDKWHFTSHLWPNQWSLTKSNQDTKRNVWTRSLQWYPNPRVNVGWGIETTKAIQSQAYFQNVPKCWKWAKWASVEILSGNEFSKVTE